jgi:hypothetical protein
LRASKLCQSEEKQSCADPVSMHHTFPGLGSAAFTSALYMIKAALCRAFVVNL